MAATDIQVAVLRVDGVSRASIGEGAAKKLAGSRDTAIHTDQAPTR